MLVTQVCKEVSPYIWRRLVTEQVQPHPPSSLSLSLSLSLNFLNEIDVDAWEYKRTPKYAPGNSGKEPLGFQHNLA